ncbi:unnamed protein product [Chrysoparadoxa australica]
MLSFMRAQGRHEEEQLVAHTRYSWQPPGEEDEGRGQGYTKPDDAELSHGTAKNRIADGFISGKDAKKMMKVCLTLCNEVRRVEGIIWHLARLFTPREGMRITPMKAISFKMSRSLVGVSLLYSLLKITIGSQDDNDNQWPNEICTICNLQQTVWDNVNLTCVPAHTEARR